jgi:hypothetical protein
MATWADGLLTGQLPERQRRYAELTSDDHHVTWRIRNLLPDPVAVQAVADAWRARRPASVLPDPRLVPQPQQSEESHRARLLATIAADRPTPHLAIDASSMMSSVQPVFVHDGDVHLAEGRYHQAVACYRRALSDDATRVAAWTGLSLARQRTADAVEAAIWRNHPEFVHALYSTLVTRGGEPPCPEELARWLAGAR